MADRLHANPARQPKPARVFIARSLTKVAPQALDAMGDIAFVFAPIASIHDMIDAGRLCPAPHVASLHRCLRALQPGAVSRGC